MLQLIERLDRQLGKKRYCLGLLGDSSLERLLQYEFGDRFLFAPLGMKVDWWRDGANNFLTYCCIDSRDFARFGLLWLSAFGINLFCIF